MPRVLQQYIEPLASCSYLPDRSAALETRVMVGVTPDEFETMLVRGWRRFGPAYFRPACGHCRECVPIRIPVARFRASTSQRRAARGCASLRAVVGAPSVSPERLDLYHRWHAMREDRRGWESAPLDAEQYALQFAFPHPCAREVTFYDDAAQGGSKLVGVGLCDETTRVWSAAYFYYDPEYARRSIGVANVLWQIEHARRRGIPHVYLGFRIAGCASMQYKSRFRPHELLRGRPAMNESPEWFEATE